MRLGFTFSLLKQSFSTSYLRSQIHCYQPLKWSYFRLFTVDITRKYSQQQAEQTTPPLVIAKKSRARKKKQVEGKSVEKTGVSFASIYRYLRL